MIPLPPLRHCCYQIHRCDQRIFQPYLDHCVFWSFPVLFLYHQERLPADSSCEGPYLQTYQSRFFIVELEPYTYEQFFEITRQLLSHQKIEREVANLIARAVWARSQDMRDCIKIGSMARTMEDVDFLINMLHSQKCK